MRKCRGPHTGNVKGIRRQKMNFRSWIAVICGKLAYYVLRKLGRGSGSVLPGQIAHRINPEILTELSGMVRKKIIAVTGTNGKTTTNHILAHVLEESGQKTVCNSQGANLMNGIITAFVLAAGANGKLDADYACIEVDELASVEIFPKLKPDLVVLTNVFRDQLDRMGEVDLVCNKIQKAIESVPDVRLVVNCDDIASYALALQCGRQTVTVGIGEQIAAGMPAGIGESMFCPFCGSRLIYEFVHYGQLGIYHCPGCGLERPRPDVTVTDVAYRNGTYAFVLDGVRIESGASAPYNVYNTLSAYAALKAVALPEVCSPGSSGNLTTAICGNASTISMRHMCSFIWQRIQSCSSRRFSSFQGMKSRKISSSRLMMRKWTGRMCPGCGMWITGIWRRQGRSPSSPAGCGGGTWSCA